MQMDDDNDFLYRRSKFVFAKSGADKLNLAAPSKSCRASQACGEKDSRGLAVGEPSHENPECWPEASSSGKYNIFSSRQIYSCFSALFVSEGYISSSTKVRGAHEP